MKRARVWVDDVSSTSSSTSSLSPAPSPLCFSIKQYPPTLHAPVPQRHEQPYVTASPDHGVTPSSQTVTPPPLQPSVSACTASPHPAGGTTSPELLDLPAEPRRRAGSRSKGTPYIPSYMRPEDGPYPCVVCGDAATGHHYRAMTCEGCKGFFRRTVQNEQRLGHSPYACQNSGNCPIGRDSRNGCQACRFKKCLDSGMSTESVLKPEQRQAKRQKIEENRLKKQQLANVTGSLSSQMTEDEHEMTRIIADSFTRHLNLPHYNTSLPLLNASELYADKTQFLRAYVPNVLIPFSVETVKFARSIPTFLEFGASDQIALIAAGFCQLLCVRIASELAAVTVQSGQLLPIGGGLAVKLSSCLADQQSTSSPRTCSEDVYSVFESIIQFAMELNKLELDLTETAMFAAAALVQPELYSGLENKTGVHNLETVLLTTLVHYSCERRRGAQPVNLMDTVNLTQKYCAVRADLARAGETFCREQLALTNLDHQLGLSWLQIANSVDVAGLPYQLSASPTCAL